MPELPYANRPLRVGVQLQPQHADYADLRRAVAAAEEAGVDVILTWDHFFPLGGDSDGKHFECWTMLAAWAEQTERVELSALVTATPTAILTCWPIWPALLITSVAAASSSALVPGGSKGITPNTVMSSVRRAPGSQH